MISRLLASAVTCTSSCITALSIVLEALRIGSISTSLTCLRHEEPCGANAKSILASAWGLVNTSSL